MGDQYIFRRAVKTPVCEVMSKEPVTVDMVNQLYEFGLFQYSCGSYQHASELLLRFRMLVGIHARRPALRWAG